MTYQELRTVAAHRAILETLDQLGTTEAEYIADALIEFILTAAIQEAEAGWRACYEPYDVGPKIIGALWHLMGKEYPA